MKHTFLHHGLAVVFLLSLFFICEATQWKNEGDIDQYENAMDENDDWNKWTKEKPNLNGCPKEGFQANPADCTKFIRCVSNGASFTRYDFDCGPGTVFDERISQCNHAWALNRDSLCYRGHGSRPENNNNNNYNRPSNPHKHIQNHRQPQQQQQLQQQPQVQQYGNNENHWRIPIVRVASSKSIVSVQSTVSTKEGSDSSSSSQESQTSPDVAETSTSSTAENEINDDDNVNLECPNAGSFPHPKNCSKFYRCVDYGTDGKNPTYIIFQYGCSPGEIFDPTSDKCELIQNVDPKPEGCAIVNETSTFSDYDSNSNALLSRSGKTYSAGPIEVNVGLGPDTTPLPNGLSKSEMTPEQLAIEQQPACPAMIALPLPASENSDKGDDDNSTAPMQIFVSSFSADPSNNNETDNSESSTTTTTTTTTSTTTSRPLIRVTINRSKSQKTTTTTSTTTTSTTSSPEVEAEAAPEFSLSCAKGGSSSKLRANPFDCSKYYTCSYIGDSFVIKVRKCPEGQNFIEEQQTCGETDSPCTPSSDGENEIEARMGREISNDLKNQTSLASNNNTEAENGTLTDEMDLDSESAQDFVNATTTPEPITELINPDNSCPKEGNFGIPGDCFRFYACRYVGPHLSSLLMKCPRGYYFVQGLCRASDAKSREEVTCSQQSQQSESSNGEDDEAEELFNNLGVIVPRKLYHLFLENPPN